MKLSVRGKKSLTGCGPANSFETPGSWALRALPGTISQWLGVHRSLQALVCCWCLGFFILLASPQVGRAETFFSVVPLSIDYPQLFLRLKLLASETEKIGPENFRIWEDGVPVMEFSVASATPRQSLVLLLDRSSSLEKVIGDIRKSATEFLESLPPEVKIAVITFASDIDINQDFTRDKSLLAKAIQDVRSWGGTVLYDASLLAIEQLWAVTDPRDLRTLVLFTDGRDETPVGRRQMSTHSFDDVLKAAARRNVRILTVGLGSEIDEQKLTRMAQVTNGYYLFAPSSKALFKIYQTLSRRLKRERHLNIQYLTGNPIRDGGQHLVKVEGVLHGVTEIASGTYYAPLDPKMALAKPTQRVSLDIGQPSLPASLAIALASPPVSLPSSGSALTTPTIRDRSLRQWVDALKLKQKKP